MPPSSTAPLAARDEFLVALRAADILTPNQFTKAQALALAGADTATDAATALVAARLLTRFQADRLLAGHTDGFVLGQHIVLDLVGRGAVSRVYKSKHRTMNRLVAIKVLSEKLAGTAVARDEFRRGVRDAGQLAHPNVVTAYDAGEIHDRPFLVLEFVDGPNLEELIRQRGPLPVNEACEFIRQAAAGLQHAHEKGMLHRDLKPANLLVARPTPSAPLTLKIADFGIPKPNRGVSDYAAPELSSPTTTPADHRADLYSLGGIFYFMLTGRMPVVTGRLSNRVCEEVSPLFQMRPDAPPEVAAIVHRLLAKNPAARFASATELLAQLEAMCVPVAAPVGEVYLNTAIEVGFVASHETLSTEAATPTPDSAGDFNLPPTESSPWSQITDIVRTSDTLTAEMEPLARRPRLPRRKQGMPLGMLVLLLASVAFLSLAGIAFIVRLMMMK